VATDASSCVVYRAKSGLHGMVLLIDFLIPGKGVSRRLDDSIVDALRTVEAGSVEAHRRFRLVIFAMTQVLYSRRSMSRKGKNRAEGVLQ